MAWLERNSHWIGLTADTIAIVSFVNPELKLSGVFALFLGVVLALAGVLFGWFARRGGGLWRKVFAWLALIVGGGGVLYFFPTMVTRLFFENPSAHGEQYRPSVNSEFLLKAGTDPEELVGIYRVQFEQPEDAVEVVLALAPADEEQVSPFRITRTSGDDRLRTLNNLAAGEVGFRVTKVQASESVAIEMKAQRKPNSPITQATLRVATRYYKQTDCWRWKRWVHKRYP